MKIPEFSAAKGLLDSELTPTRGKKETTDHPPIYPTQAVYPNAPRGRPSPRLRADRPPLPRHLLPPMITESARADIDAGAETYFVRGSIVVDPGYAGIYTYARSADNELPALEEGQELDLDGAPWMVDKETQPPSRISQGKLIEMMEELGLGTKATRAGHHPEALRPRLRLQQPARAERDRDRRCTRRSRSTCQRMATPEMTAELEADMDQIAAGDMTHEEVLTDQPRRCSIGTYDDLFANAARSSRKVIWARDGRGQVHRPLRGLRGGRSQAEDGSPNRLRIIEMRGGKRFVGCEGYNRDNPEYPDACDFSRPLPGRGYELWRLEERCTVCETTPRAEGRRPSAAAPGSSASTTTARRWIEMREKRAERQKAARRPPRQGRGEGRRGDRRRQRRRRPRTARSHAKRRRRRRPGPSPSANGRTPRRARPRPRPPQRTPVLVDGAARVFITLEGIDGAGQEHAGEAASPRRCPAIAPCSSASPAEPPTGSASRELLKDREPRR